MDSQVHIYHFAFVLSCPVTPPLLQTKFANTARFSATRLYAAKPEATRGRCSAGAAPQRDERASLPQRA